MHSITRLKQAWAYKSSETKEEAKLLGSLAATSAKSRH
jgi:hypothetical protein